MSTAAKSGGDKIVADGAKADMWGLESETEAEKEAERDAVSLRRATALFNMASVLRARGQAGALPETAEAAVDPKKVAQAVGLLRRVLLLRTGVAAAASGEPWAKLSGSAVVDLVRLRAWQRFVVPTSASLVLTCSLRLFLPSGARALPFGWRA